MKPRTLAALEDAALPSGLWRGHNGRWHGNAGPHHANAVMALVGAGYLAIVPAGDRAGITAAGLAELARHHGLGVLEQQKAPAHG